VTTAQVIFVIALSVAAIIIVAFAVYVISTTLWGNRWVRMRQTGQSKGVKGEVGKDAS
jgi:hypothetical protein